MNSVKCRIRQLQEWLAEHYFDACIVPHTDPHLSEYVEPYDCVRAYFSGFTGSAGTLVVTQQEAGLWTDSRYYIQAEQQLQNTSIVLFKDGQPQVPAYKDWLLDKIGKQARVAVNACCFSHAQWEECSALFTLVHEATFEKLWTNRPILSKRACTRYQGAFTSATQHVHDLREVLKQKQVDACLISALDDIAWLLQVRGDDIPYVPVVRSYLWVDAMQICWWVDACKVKDAQLLEHLHQLGVTLLPYEKIADDLAQLTPQKVWIDQTLLNQRVYQLLEKHVLVQDTLWITEQKAIKSQEELLAIQQVMIPDAVAWVRSLKWLQEQLYQHNRVSELDFQQQMLCYKSQGSAYIAESFAPIVAYGEHAAIVHYESTPQSNIPILPHGFLLVDAGSHYAYGTTDVTRTIVCGPLTEQQRTVYTLVLKGMIAMATAVFSTQTPSAEIDALARKPLQQYGYDYGHGTGHGIGTVLSVHERGVRISPYSFKPLRCGMVLSDEPGCYLEGMFGVRLENMLAVQPEQVDVDSFTLASAAEAESSNLLFKTLTIIPFDCRAIDVCLLTDAEKQWINAYHEHVMRTLQANLTTEEYNWLKSYTYEL